MLDLAELRNWIEYLESADNVETDTGEVWAFARVELDEPLLDPVTRPPGIPWSDPRTTVRTRRLVITGVWLPPSRRAAADAPALEQRYGCPFVVSSEWDRCTPEPA